MEEILVNNDNNFKLTKKTKFILIGMMVIILAMFTLAISRKKVIDLGKYISIKTSGYNGYGVAEWSFDYGEFEEDYSEKLKYTKSSEKKEIESWITPCILVQMIFNGDIDNSEKLSNGDCVNFSWNEVDEEYVSQLFNYKFKLTPVSVTVNGLEEIEHFNAFDSLEIEYYGCSPMAEVRVINNNNDKFLQTLKYKVDKEEGLANGDKFKITVSAPSGKDLNTYCAEKYGKIPTTDFAEYTVSGLNSYVTAIDQIPEEFLERMKNEVVDHLHAQAAEDFEPEVSIEEEQYLGAYVLNRKTGAYNTTNNYIYLIFNVKVLEDFSSQGLENHRDYYYYGMWENVVINTTGECKAELANVSVCEKRFSQRLNIPNGYWDHMTLYYKGYESLDRLVNDCIITKVDRFTYTSTVQDVN